MPELGVTPADYVEKARLEAACRRLELGDDSLEHVALDVGFGTVETLRRALKRALGVGPAEYRALRRRADTRTDAAGPHPRRRPARVE